jgi:hypothetical protein
VRRMSNPMETTDRFSHGTYGDDSGVCFCAITADVSSDHRLAVSDRFIGPLFSAIIDRSQSVGLSIAPKLVTAWNSLSGWADGSGIQPIDQTDADELANALALVSTSDVQPHLAGVTSEECVRCGQAIADFLRYGLSHSMPLFIEDD